jgi:Fur family transcriptional regulator, peroxide stress response regulator
LETNITYRYSYKSLKAKLGEFSLKATQQRIVIYEALLRLENHPAAEAIYEAIKPNNPSVSLGTVYKTLDTFVTVGLAVKVMSEEGFMRYDANMGYHNHIYCTNTKELLDYEDEELNTLIEEFFKKKNIQNLKIKDVRLQINGEKIDLEKNVTIK